ncbi:MAG: hypothetical protein K9N29_00460 [Candidatus Marinimicrobia bacterium]|nr:hypothetical protein [Candidatus Neomarinimicrobiota bacterium]
MADTHSHIKVSNAVIDPWLVWFIFFTSALIFISLFIVSSALWYLVIAGLTLIVLWITSPAPLRTLGFILGLVGLLALLQILFSPFMRALLLRSMDEGFVWSDWQYLLIAVERFAWPLVLVSSFQSRLSNPAILAQLTAILSPLEWVGLKISKLQTLIILALRFIPSLKLEWERFTKFQLYFLSGLPRKTLFQKLRFWQGVFKAMISHTIHRSITTGDLLAMRGLPQFYSRGTSNHLPLLILLWLLLGFIFLFFEKNMSIVWVCMSVWLGMLSLGRKLEVRP